MIENELSGQTRVAIIGGGPIGLELAVALQEAGIDYVLLEGKQIGHAFTQWPPNTHFFSAPEHVALAGVPVHTQNQLPISGEEYLAYLRMLVEMHDLNIRVYEPVTAIEKSGDGFLVNSHPQTGQKCYRAEVVVLATGGMARPRLLGIPGEDLSHVSHYFRDPHAYFRTRVLVVGGKNSALESALRCWRTGATVAMSYRRPDFDYDVVKPHLAMDISDRLMKGEITFYPATMPLEITSRHVVLAGTEEGVTPVGPTFNLPADFVLLCTGFEADMSLFEMVGVELLGAAQAPVYDERTMETTVPGLYVAGTAAGGTQSRFVHFISTSHDHVARIVKAITGQQPEKLGSVASRNSAVAWEEVKAN
jgi:thioredoxin reductase (NADPH)